MVKLEDMLEAYYDCRKHKRKTASAVVYEMDYEPKLIALVNRINDRTYYPGKSICFVVTRPRYREVFAASFEDRIVHHYIALRLEPLFEQIFNDRTYNCRKGKGQLYGIKRLQQDMWDCSEGYKRDCWIMKLDLKGFFMSIDKAMLARKIDDFILGSYHNSEDKEDLRFLCRTAIMHCPERNCVKRSPQIFWSYLTKDKSLFSNGEGKGVAIGNLFAQHFANFFLNDLDWFLESKCKYHGRYVDDFYCMDADKDRLLGLMHEIRSLLTSWGLRLNEKKFYLQHYTKGVRFTGMIVKPYRTYLSNTPIGNCYDAIFKLNNAKTVRQIRHLIQSVNSYLGMMVHCNEYGTRRRILNRIDKRLRKYIYIKGGFRHLALKKKYTKQREMALKIKYGNWK